jgi:hypothetical protein
MEVTPFAQPLQSAKRKLSMSVTHPTSSYDLLYIYTAPGACFLTYFSRKYELYVQNNHRKACEPAKNIQTFYSQLQYILECDLLCHTELGIPDGHKYLLAVIVPCITNSKDTTWEATTYHTTSTAIVINLQVIGCVVGHVKRGQDWGIVERSGDLARTAFVDPENNEVA